MNRLLVLSLSVIGGVGLSQLAHGQPKDWSNEFVLPKRLDVVIKVADKPVPFAIFPGQSNPVPGASDLVKVWSGHHEGTVPKSDLLFAATSVAYFDELLRRNPKDRWALQCRAIAHRENAEPDQAMRDIQEAIRRDPDDAVGYVHRAKLWPDHEKDRLTFADYEKAISLDRDCASAYMYRAELWQGYSEIEKATADYGQVIRIDPDNVHSRLQRAYCLMDLEQFGKAIEDYDALVRLEPDNCMFHNGRGAARSGAGDHKGAIADYDEAIRLLSSFPQAFFNRAVAWHALGEYRKALGDIDDSVRLYSKDPDARLFKAWILATCPDANLRDGQKAVELALDACKQQDFRVPPHLSTLAAAYSEIGRFDEAIKWQRKAIELEALGPKLDYRGYLQLYQDGKPARSYQKESKK